MVEASPAKRLSGKWNFGASCALFSCCCCGHTRLWQMTSRRVPRQGYLLVDQRTGRAVSQAANPLEYRKGDLQGNLHGSQCLIRQVYRRGILAAGPRRSQWAIPVVSLHGSLHGSPRGSPHGSRRASPHPNLQFLLESHHRSHPVNLVDSPHGNPQPSQLGSLRHSQQIRRGVLQHSPQISRRDNRRVNLRCNRAGSPQGNPRGSPRVNLQGNLRGNPLGSPRGNLVGSPLGSPAHSLR